MTKNEIIRIAQKCGHWSGETVEMNDVGIMEFAALVAKHEREACAKLVDHILKEGGGTYGDAIKARGNT
jgi:hypothetical protein